MPHVRTWLFVVLAAFAVAYLTTWAAALLAARRAHSVSDPAHRVARPTLFELALGFVTNFFDTLGIGSFAPTTSVFKLRRLVPDQLIPGTLNVGHTLPTITQAFIYISIIEVDMSTLVLLVSAAVVGAWLGAGIVSAWPRRKVQIGMGLALLGAAALMLLGLFHIVPAGGDALGLGDGALVVGVAGSFVLGALMTIGIGFYAPCMIMIALLGMNPRAAFPIMMGACAFLMPMASIRFIRRRAYSVRPALGLAAGGIPGVLIAAFIVWSLPLDAIRWLVVAVVIYTATAMLRSALAESRLPVAAAAADVPGRAEPAP
jgi:uncharacterized membrane protein YfcA